MLILKESLMIYSFLKMIFSLRLIPFCKGITLLLVHERNEHVWLSLLRCYVFVIYLLQLHYNTEN